MQCYEFEVMCRILRDRAEQLGRVVDDEIAIADVLDAYAVESLPGLLGLEPRILDLMAGEVATGVLRAA